MLAYWYTVVKGFLGKRKGFNAPFEAPLEDRGKQVRCLAGGITPGELGKQGRTDPSDLASGQAENGCPMRNEVTLVGNTRFAVFLLSQA
jgi:hypothetical protein